MQDSRLAGGEERWLRAPDGVRSISSWRRGGNGSRLVVIAPGYAQNHRTRSMRALAERLDAWADTVVVSFRGTGGSEGRFSFGASDYLDLAPVLEEARRQYADISLLGFSLGTYSSLRFQLAYPGRAARLFLVSAFASPQALFRLGTWWRHPVQVLFRRVRFRLRPQNQPWFRWGRLSDPKPDLAAAPLIPGVPCHFLAGGQDTLVPPALSRALFASVLGPKTWRLMDPGVHAEQMFLQDPDYFLGWLKSPEG